MSKNLVIVESPAKAKTIEKYLGKNFKVLSSIGHIRSIAKKSANDKPPIDISNGYETIFEIDPEKKKVISELKKATKIADTVWLATDEDREGEAIAWHLAEVLKLDINKTKRIVFHEITKSAIDEAVKNPRTINMDLVQAQQARQILDRLVGFELSPVVWKKVPGGKSAGRVQSPAVRLLVEKEREIEKFNSSSYYKITAEFKFEKEIIQAELSEKLNSEDEAYSFLNSILNKEFKVSKVTKSPSTRNPSAPFTTSTLQQEANSRLGFSAKATMSSAQKLYQDGKITYMRTDSVNLSNQALAMISGYVKENFGEKYYQIRKYRTKSANAQEAHEAIRPTDIKLEIVSSNEYEQKIYDLIRRRTIASQMASAELQKTNVVIDIFSNKNIDLEMFKEKNLYFEAKGETVIFDGFLKIYGSSKKEQSLIPSVKDNDILYLKNVNAHQSFTRPPARYTEGSLVKKLEELGIGRPSTYATILNTIQIRGYAKKGEDEGNIRDVISLNLKNNSIMREIIQEKYGSNRGKLMPTPTGEVVSDFLVGYFDKIVDYGFTAKVEADFDKIAIGSLARNLMLDSFYKPFHKLIEKSDKIDRSTVAKAREIGIDPDSNKPIFARFGRFGPMLQMGTSENKDEKPRFAPMPIGKKIETVTLDEALYAFKLPRLIGQTEDEKDIFANIGRFGPYIQVEKMFVSIKPFDPYNITLEESLNLYKDKLKSEAEKNIADFGNGIKILKGRFGPYITNGNKNVKIPKEIDPTNIDLEKAKEIIESSKSTKKRRIPRRIKNK